MFDDGILRVRGGSSETAPDLANVCVYSPRARR